MALSDITIAGNLSTASSFQAAGSETVTFTPGASHTITGSNQFYNLTIDDSSVATADTITFAASASQIVLGTLILKGNATNNLKLRSSSTPTQWWIFPQSVITVGGYLDVKDSLAVSNTIHSGANFINSGNNTSWIFP